MSLHLMLEHDVVQLLTSKPSLKVLGLRTLAVLQLMAGYLGVLCPRMDCILYDRCSPCFCLVPLGNGEVVAGTGGWCLSAVCVHEAKDTQSVTHHTSYWPTALLWGSA